MDNANITKNDSKTQTTPLKQIHVSAAVIFRTAAGSEKLVFATLIRNGKVQERAAGSS